MDISNEALNLTPAEAWSRFRFAVVSRLLAMPPDAGNLQREIAALAAESWRNPVTKAPMTLSRQTIERWYYLAKSAPRDPVSALRKRPRCDAGRFPAVSAAVRCFLEAQHRAYPRWTYLLHHENLLAAARSDESLGRPPSYPTLLRYMRATGLLRDRRRHPKEDGRPGHEARETRSFEVDRPNALWHLDFHHGSRRVLTDEGAWVKPIGLAVLDDHSRVVLHFQWYLHETTQTLCHALWQAILRFGVPLALLSDNGAPMTSEETTNGLARLGVVHYTTLPYSPHQNGKQETWFASLEGRLMAMLDGVQDLTLRRLNDLTSAWILHDYNRREHRELGMSPLDRHLGGQDAGRVAPPLDHLRDVFRRDVRRTVRRSDGTVSLEGKRFEIPFELATLRRVLLRYATWDLTTVHLVDERTGSTTHRVWPLDKQRNADRRRRRVEPAPGAASASSAAESETAAAPRGEAALPPLAQELLRRQRESGLLPPYLPLDDALSSKPWDEGGDDGLALGVEVAR